MSSKAMQDHCGSSATSASIARLGAIWAGLSLTLPLDLIASSLGKSVRSYLQMVTGLSQAHLATRGLHVRHEKRRLEVLANIEKTSRSHLEGQGYSAREIDEVLRDMPSAPLAQLVYWFAQCRPGSLPLAAEYAKSVNALCVNAQTALQEQCLATYKRALADFIQAEFSDGGTGSSSRDVETLMCEIDAADDWAGLGQPSNDIAMLAMVSLLAAVDAEWTPRYFGRLQPVPTFLWMLPKVDPALRECGLDKPRKRPLLESPTRRLLQMLWLIMKRRTSATHDWPACRPGPAELARDIGQIDLSDALISKWFAGAKPLRLAEVLVLWEGLSGMSAGADRYEPPLPWMAIAIWAERVLVRRYVNSTKLASVVLLSEDQYRSAWSRHRARWGASAPVGGDLSWPRWLVDQSSSPEWIWSSQSSGLSSSPRDCQ